MLAPTNIFATVIEIIFFRIDILFVVCLYCFSEQHFLNFSLLSFTLLLNT